MAIVTSRSDSSRVALPELEPCAGLMAKVNSSAFRFGVTWELVASRRAAGDNHGCFRWQRDLLDVDNTGGLQPAVGAQRTCHPGDGRAGNVLRQQRQRQRQPTSNASESERSWTSCSRSST